MSGRQTLLVSFLMISLAALGGCYESGSVTVHKPGMYQGKEDPLLQKQRNAEANAALVERFKLVQTDR